VFPCVGGTSTATPDGTKAEQQLAALQMEEEMANTRSQHRSVPPVRTILAVLVLLTLIAATPRTARAAAAWQFGAGTHTLARNCITSNQEIMSIDNAGYYGEPGVSPVVGQKYYVQGTWGITGDPCGTGQAKVHVEFMLPQGTQLAISAADPVHCIFENFTDHTTTEDTANCPQVPVAGLQGGLAFDRSWDTPQGYAWHILVPVISTQPLSGSTIGDCPSCLTAAIWVIDGDTNPWTYPQIGIPVLAGGSPSPSPRASASPSPSPSPSASPSPSPTIRFTDVPTGYWAYTQITTFAQRGITTGCDTGLYCPDRGVTRAEMAVFLDRTLGYGTPPPPSGQAFTDVPANYWAYAYIAQFAKLGITTGCGGTEFCPDRGVTRAEMAAFLIRALKGSQLTPATPTFADVPASHPQYGYVEALVKLGVTTGCGTNAQGKRLFCPDRGVTRAEMAVFITRAFP